MSKSDKTVFEGIWGSEVEQAGGYAMVPVVIYESYWKLGRHKDRKSGKWLPGINIGAVPLLISLCKLMNPGELVVWPARDTLRASLGVHGRDIDKYVAQLEQSGLLKVIKGTKGRGKEHVTHYDLSPLVAEVKRMAVEQLQEGAQPASEAPLRGQVAQAEPAPEAPVEANTSVAQAPAEQTPVSPVAAVQSDLPAPERYVRHPYELRMALLKGEDPRALFAEANEYVRRNGPHLSAHWFDDTFKPLVTELNKAIAAQSTPTLPVKLEATVKSVPSVTVAPQAAVSTVANDDDFDLDAFTESLK